MSSPAGPTRLIPARDTTGRAASWYGSAFHGRLTANGEIFDRESIAAAHPTLPLPSYVRVTNVVNNRSMVVRVNDRGPYERDRVIDLSERAADALGFHRKGTSRVRVQYVGRASLDGSDDAKLLATLRMDGPPARFEPPRTMVAEARPAARDTEHKGPPLASALRQVRPGNDEGRAAPHRTASALLAVEDRSAVRAVAAMDARKAPDVVPPRRPDFRGVR